MSPEEWLTSNDPAAMLRWMTLDRTSTGWRHISDRKLRLFACACRRRVPGLSWSGQSAGWQEMEDHPEREILANGVGPRTVSAEEHARLFLSEIMRPEGQPSDSQMADLLREIIGNPFRHYVVAERQYAKTLKEYQILDLNWFTPAVVSLATAAYQERPKLETEGPEILAGLDCPYCANWPKDSQQGQNGYVKCKQWRSKPSFGREYAEGETEHCMKCNRVWEPGYDTVSVVTRTEDGRLDNSRLAVLADALEDAGCPAEIECDKCHNGWVTHFEYIERVGAICGVGQKPCPHCGGASHVPNPLLSHLRSDGPHVRGCWVLDILLGKQ